MPLLPDMRVRSVEHERMDDVQGSEAMLLRTVAQFEQINRLLARHRMLLSRWVLEDMARDPGREYTLLDLGAGGCDIAVWLLGCARRRGLKLTVTGWDHDPRTAAYARRVRGQVPGLVIREADALTTPIEQPFDYLFANHVLHHLLDDQIVALLRRWAPQVRRCMLFSDLVRGPASYIGFWLLTLGLWRGSFARADGLLSICRGFRPPELRVLAERAGLGAQGLVLRVLPGRLALVIHPGAVMGMSC